MRTNIVITPSLMSEAMLVSGAPTKKAAVETGLQLVVTRARQLEALDRLAEIGWDGDLDDIRESRLP